jgi:hypothetical protein
MNSFSASSCRLVAPHRQLDVQQEAGPVGGGEAASGGHQEWKRSVQPVRAMRQRSHSASSMGG